MLAGAGLIALAVLQAAGIGLGFALTASVAGRITGSSLRRGRFDGSLLRELLRFGGMQTMIALGSVVSFQLDAFITVAPAAAQVAEEPLLPHERLPRGTGIPQHERVHPLAAHGLVGGEQAADPDADEPDVRDAGGHEHVGGRRDAGQSRPHPVGVGLLTGGVARPVVVEAQHGQAALGQEAVGVVDADRLDAERLAEHHATADRAFRRQVQPAEERSVVGTEGPNQNGVGSPGRPVGRAVTGGPDARGSCPARQVVLTPSCNSGGGPGAGPHAEGPPLVGARPLRGRPGGRAGEPAATGSRGPG